MALPDYINEDISLGRLTTFRIGGPARWLAYPDTVDRLRAVLAFARERQHPVHVLGGGSNVLIADDGVDGLVLKLSAEGEFGAVRQDVDDPCTWRVGAAVPLASLVAATVAAGIAGLEGLAGIPGTVGGAAAMNAGARDAALGDFVVDAGLIAMDGVMHRVGRDCLAFAYRRSGIGDRIATDVSLRFPGREEPDVLRERIRRFLAMKRSTQPLAVPSAGCVFTNPPGSSAGKLLDAAGCKGMREGGAETSRVHANFIVNGGAATARDVAALALRMREAVRTTVGVTLVPEIKLLGDEPLFASLRHGE